MAPLHDVMVEAPDEKRFGGLVGTSRATRQVYSLIRKAARVNIPVLIVGETGTGKELVAKEIHERSARADGPFVAVNTGALSSDLVASELFGHIRGSFTGALDNKVGRYEEADGGTLFLDEIATMEDRVQVALLRMLETGTYRPVGAKTDKSAQVRIIGATNENLWYAAKAGHFREDLLHRFEVIRIALPALREHIEDVPMLAQHFLEQFRAEFEFEIDGIREDAMALLMRYRWPGNVRELKNVIAEACVMAEAGPITPRHIPRRISAPSENDTAKHFAPEPLGNVDAVEERAGNGSAAAPMAAPDEAEDGIFVRVGSPLEEVQKAYVLKTLAHCSNNKTLAARILGLSRKTLYDKLARWGITP